jgi:hypothetical protein
MMRLLRPARSGIFLRSFRLHSVDYVRETIAKICSLGAVLATAIMSQTGSRACGDSLYNAMRYTPGASA